MGKSVYSLAVAAVLLAATMGEAESGMSVGTAPDAQGDPADSAREAEHQQLVGNAYVVFAESFPKATTEDVWTDRACGTYDPKTKKYVVGQSTPACQARVSEVNTQILKSITADVMRRTQLDRNLLQENDARHAALTNLLDFCFRNKLAWTDLRNKDFCARFKARMKEVWDGPSRAQSDDRRERNKDVNRSPAVDPDRPARSGTPGGNATVAPSH